ncbi:MAG: 3-phosphoserine/phosphohydroxythreonine transaminase [Gammaproteobacteria bacterium]|nr:3-phosphoserine/phosphohydroxythreonine transaminase [Gammaproteobacteria bacterium]
MERVYNFSAGPATLPIEVLQQAKDELLDWNNLGMSVMEISHRGKDYLAVAEESEANFRDLLTIPHNYKVLFLQGGARSQFAMVPMNLLGHKNTVDYLDSGIWSGLAIKEAERYAQVNIVASSKESKYTTIPERQAWQLNPQSAYFHYVDNETINGLEFPSVPEVGALTLVSDMSSNILSRPIDIPKFGLIYAGAQKNVGPAGLTIVIVNEALLGEALSITPSMFNYALHAKENSMYNTPPTFSWYVAGLTFKWLKAKGGVEALAKANATKSKKLYQCIDNNDFYYNSIAAHYRSRMNVVFSLKDESLNDQFLETATANGLANLKGHKLVGGMRASLYNAMPEEGVDCLISFMNDFSKRYG